MKYFKVPITSLLLGFTVVGSQAMAADVALHGFVRTALDISNSSAAYMGVIDDKGSFGGSLAALSYSAKLNGQWSVAGQLFSKVQEGELELDWAFANFQVSDTTQFRFGKQKYPLGLMTESVDLGLAYAWVRPPEEFYTLENGDESANVVKENIDGVSMVYTTGDEWEFNLQPFVGQHDYTETSTNMERSILGLKMEAVGEIATLQAGYARSKMTIAGELDNQDKTTYNLGASLDLDNYVAILEYADTQVEDNDDFDAKAGYASLGYRLGQYLPSVTYASVEGQSGKLDQTSVTLAVAYTYNASTVFKAQWKNIKPDDPSTDGLIEALPAGDTRADIVSFTMDVIF